MYFKKYFSCVQFYFVGFWMGPFWSTETLFSIAVTYKVKKKLLTLLSRIKIESPFSYGEKYFLWNSSVQDSH